MVLSMTRVTHLAFILGELNIYNSICCHFNIKTTKNIICFQTNPYFSLLSELVLNLPNQSAHVVTTPIQFNFNLNLDKQSHQEFSILDYWPRINDTVNEFPHSQPIFFRFFHVQWSLTIIDFFFKVCLLYLKFVSTAARRQENLV